jgi:hypothetical protein
MMMIADASIWDLASFLLGALVCVVLVVVIIKAVEELL